MDTDTENERTHLIWRLAVEARDGLAGSPESLRDLAEILTNLADDSNPCRSGHCLHTDCAHDRVRLTGR